MKITNVFITCLLGAILPNKLTTRQVVQINIDDILNARPVSTLTGGKLMPWRKGVDGNGNADGYLTQAAAGLNGDKNAHALPDDPAIPADASHPQVILHYSNSDSVKQQAVFISGAGEISFKVPPNGYSALYLALTSAEGAAPLKIQLIYTDGVSYRNILLLDYYQDLPANGPNFCYLVHDLAKWGTKNNMTEKDHHNIDLLNLHPDPKRQLTGIKIKKGQAGYLVFWAATGVTGG